LPGFVSPPLDLILQVQGLDQDGIKETQLLSMQIEEYAV